MVVAVRQALDSSNTGRAVVVCVIGWILFVVVNLVLLLAFGGVAFVLGS